MTIETLAILTFCDGRRRVAPISQVMLTRWELGLLGYALGWPATDDEKASGGQYLAQAARRYDAPTSTDDHDDDPDTSFWLDSEQVRQIVSNLRDTTTREAIVNRAARMHTPAGTPDRLISCMQMLSQAASRQTGVHVACYMC